MSAINSTLLKSAIKKSIFPKDRYLALDANFKDGRFDAFTFSRVGNQSFVDFEGILKTAKEDEPAINGLRYVKNLLRFPTDLTMWDSDDGGAATDNGDGTFTLDLPNFQSSNVRDVYIDSVDKYQFQGSVDFKGVGSNIGKDIDVLLSRQNGGTFTYKLITVTLTADWKRVETGVFTPSTDNNNCRFNIRNSGATSVEVRRPLLEFVHGQTNKTSSSYVEDYKYFNYKNGNTVSNNVVTENKGDIISDADGVLFERSRTNVATFSRDLTNPAWVKTNIVTALDAIGIDGELNAASTLTASAGNGTCFLSITKSSAENTFRAYVKRVTGTGTIEITDDGGATYTDITSLINSSTFTEVSITNTVTDPTIGFRIAESGDEIEVDYATLETGAFYTSAIETNGSTVTRSSITLSKTHTLPINNISGQILVRPQFNYNDAREGFTRIVSFTDSAEANVLRLIWDNNNDRIFLAKDVDAVKEEVSTLANELQFSKNELLNIRFKIDSADGIKLWVNDLTVKTNTGSVSKENFSSVLTDVFIGSKGGGDVTDDSYQVVESLKIWHTAKSDPYLESLT